MKRSLLTIALVAAVSSVSAGVATAAAGTVCARSDSRQVTTGPGPAQAWGDPDGDNWTSARS